MSEARIGEARGRAVSTAARGPAAVHGRAAALRAEAADPEAEAPASTAAEAPAAVLKAEAAALAEAVPASEENNTRKTKRELNRFPFDSLIEFGQAILWKTM